MTQPLPLEGIKVIDFTQVMLGPSCTQVLADYGAEVIKVEKEKIGDLSRWSLGADPDGLNNPIFCSLNRNKKSLALNLKSEEARAQVLELIDTADVVVNNFRPGVMERMGMGFDDLKARNPGIIFAVGTGFGLEGPNKHKGGQDILAQAMSGVMERRSDPELPRAIFSTALCDYTAGMHLVQGVLLAILQRQKTGEGQQVAVSLYSSMLAMQMQEAAAHMMRGRDLNWGAFPLTGVFETTTEPFVMVGAFKENPLRDICNALGIEDLSQEERFRDFDAQAAHRAELQAIFKREFARNSREHWLARLEEVDILCAPVRTLAEALDDEQTIVNNMVIEAGETPAGKIRLVGSPIDMSAAPLSVRQGPPQLGEHNGEILSGFAPKKAQVA
ncbi:CaiB/BaiF CoA transferase family protein [Limimaricola litoreus]|uniref:CoA transferase n=1 Tax=Limimaricola litoreus TaxID=2955316 RepID=A0A9X2JP27_9RHOB|nr:CaiB/BaiF CoA-transferase family protein [Limimaricola litoreus]MCP1169572.1 CoA transferase [Limimaricola litoreus]